MATINQDLSAPLYPGLVDPLPWLRRQIGVFTNLHLNRKDRLRRRAGPRLIAIPEPRLRGQALARSGGATSLANSLSGTALHGMVESWSPGAAESPAGNQRTAVFGAEQDLLLDQRQLSLQSELALRDGDAARAGGPARSFAKLGTAVRFAGEEPSGRASYSVAFNYVGADLRPNGAAGDELGLRFNGGWAIDDATRLTGHLGNRIQGLGGDNPQNTWRAGLSVRRGLLPETLPGVTADFGTDVSQSGDAAQTSATTKTRLRFGLGAELLPGLHGRLAIVEEIEHDRISETDNRTSRLRLHLGQSFTLLGASARLAGEAGFLSRSGSDENYERVSAGLSFTLRDGGDSLSLRGRLTRHDDFEAPQNSGLGAELSARAVHLGSSYTAGLEAAVQDRPGDAAAASYRAGLFVRLPF